MTKSSSLDLIASDSGWPILKSKLLPLRGDPCGKLKLVDVVCDQWGGFI